MKIKYLVITNSVSILFHEISNEYSIQIDLLPLKKNTQNHYLDHCKKSVKIFLYDVKNLFIHFRDDEDFNTNLYILKHVNQLLFLKYSGFSLVKS